jgi:radial spoke head protein 4A
MRFWGKILTSKRDYYIVEGITSTKFVDDVPAGSEPMGEGANTYTYWATFDVLEEWFELPFVTPE